MLFCPYFYVYADWDDDKKGTNNSGKNMYDGLKDVIYQEDGKLDVEENESSGTKAVSNIKTYWDTGAYLSSEYRAVPKIDKKRDAFLGNIDYNEMPSEGVLKKAIVELGLKPDKQGVITAYLNRVLHIQWSQWNGKEWINRHVEDYYDSDRGWNALCGSASGRRTFGSLSYEDPSIIHGVASQYASIGLQGKKEGFIKERYNIKVTLQLKEGTVKIQRVLDAGTPKTIFSTSIYQKSSFTFSQPEIMAGVYTHTNMDEYVLDRITTDNPKQNIVIDKDKNGNISTRGKETLIAFRKGRFFVDKQLTITLYYKKQQVEEVPVTVELRCLTKKSPEEYIVTSEEVEQGQYVAGSKTTLQPSFVKDSVMYKKKEYTPERVVIQSKESGKVVKRANFRDGTTTIAAFRGAKHSVGNKGIKVIVYYSRTDTTTSPPGGGDPPSGDSNVTTSGNTETVNYLTPVGVQGVIGADIRGQEQFDVAKGIPVTENLYTCVQGQRYLVSYSVTKHSGTTTYTRNWTISVPSGTDEQGKPLMVDISDSATDTRSYTYYTISNVELYAISRAEITNDAFSTGTVILQPKNYQKPRITVSSTGEIKASPTGDPKSPDAYTQYKVANDTLVIDGKVILASEESEKRSHTSAPSHISCPSVIDNNVLFEQGLTIPVEKENGYRESKGVLVYRRLYGSGSEERKFPININEVVIHTPTVCYPSVSNEKKWNQMIAPDKSKPSFVLERPFSITMSTTGSHRVIKGYGNRDYKKYIKERQVRFPFDVYKNGENGTYVKANTWITVGTDTTTYYLPSWVKEGYHNIEFRSIAINTKNKAQVEENANKNLENYVATKTITIQVSGRVFGFAVYDISDYPLWQDVFRVPHTTKLTGVRYRVGTKTRNGVPNHLSEQLTLPLLAGSHPKEKCQGAVPLGYVTRFSIYTIGNMVGKEDSIEIKPRFYYVTKDGKQKEEVDLWYCETFEGEYQRFVKVGSKRDSRNIKKLQIGSLYRGATPYEIHNTENILGMGKYELYDAKAPVYTFGKISIPWQMRTFIGTQDNRPRTISDATVRKSFQKWYGEYYLPATLYAVKKDFDIWDWARKYGGINGLEPFWKSKKGYILVNFDIETVKNGKRHLSYINRKNEADGYCNMWKTTGFRYQKKDCKGNLFTLQDGDYAFFNLSRSVKDDYVSGGTH